MREETQAVEAAIPPLVCERTTARPSSRKALPIPTPRRDPWMENAMTALTARRSIKIHVLGTVIAVRGLAYGIAFAASIGFAVVVLHGHRVLDMVERFATWVASAKTQSTPPPHKLPIPATLERERTEQV